MSNSESKGKEKAAEKTTSATSSCSKEQAESPEKTPLNTQSNKSANSTKPNLLQSPPPPPIATEEREPTSQQNYHNYHFHRRHSRPINIRQINTQGLVNFERCALHEKLEARIPRTPSITYYHPYHYYYHHHHHHNSTNQHSPHSHTSSRMGSITNQTQHSPSHQPEHIVVASSSAKVLPTSKDSKANANEYRFSISDISSDSRSIDSALLLPTPLLNKEKSSDQEIQSSSNNKKADNTTTTTTGTVIHGGSQDLHHAEPTMTAASARERGSMFNYADNTLNAATSSIDNVISSIDSSSTLQVPVVNSSTTVAAHISSLTNPMLVTSSNEGANVNNSNNGPDFPKAIQQQQYLANNYNPRVETPTTNLIKTAVSVREVSKRISKTVVTIDNPTSVMIVCKQEKDVMDKALDLAEWLVKTKFHSTPNNHYQHYHHSLHNNYNRSSKGGSLNSSPKCNNDNGNLIVYIEDKVAQTRKRHYIKICQRIGEEAAAQRLRFWNPEMCARESSDLFDFVVVLGGDGTVLYTSWLFQKTVPAIIPFHLGSLGFLTVFDFEHCRKVLTQSMIKGMRINLRMRFSCTVYRLIDARDVNSTKTLEVIADKLSEDDDVHRKDQNFDVDVDDYNNNNEDDDGNGGVEVNSGSVTFVDNRQRGASPSSMSVSSMDSSRSSNGSPGRGYSKNNGSGEESAQDLLTRTLSQSSIFSEEIHQTRKHHHLSIHTPQSSYTTTTNNNNSPSSDGLLDLDFEIGTPIQRIPTCYESEWEDMPTQCRKDVHKVWRRGETFQVLNEVVVDRGPSPYMSMLELYGDGNLLTTVQADGLVLSTPTGSTAYSLAAGGSLVHPEIPAILVTPICPHTLSFRPMLLPDSMVIRVVVPPDSRGSAWASFDGRNRIELKQGDHIQITASQYPLPTVCANQSQSKDWFSSLSRCLSWNERSRQKHFGPAFKRSDESKSSRRSRKKSGGMVTSTDPPPVPLSSLPNKRAIIGNSTASGAQSRKENKKPKAVAHSEDCLDGSGGDGCRDCDSVGDLNSLMSRTTLIGRGHESAGSSDEDSESESDDDDNNSSIGNGSSGYNTDDSNDN
ncbi:hypothetical protein H4219_003974 [Mycoemilia scoparia]|uniref:NAD(+) kinase n=1 Tax=Mycoemilia scoparia TaxID=417184 RepID=A0A9W7ZZR8_9FUNG|nr:hypothetical protein H4219_003974 [Mycoemilia scoparia]